MYTAVSRQIPSNSDVTVFQVACCRLKPHQLLPQNLKTYPIFVIFLYMPPFTSRMALNSNFLDSVQVSCHSHISDDATVFL